MSQGFYSHVLLLHERAHSVLAPPAEEVWERTGSHGVVMVSDQHLSRLVDRLTHITFDSKVNKISVCVPKPLLLLQHAGLLITSGAIKTFHLTRREVRSRAKPRAVCGRR